MHLSLLAGRRVPVALTGWLLPQADRGTRPHVGLKLLQLTSGSAARFRQGDPQFPPVEGGLLVPAVVQGSPAHGAGLRVGDVIVGEPALPPAAGVCLLPHARAAASAAGAAVATSTDRGRHMGSGGD